MTAYEYITRYDAACYTKGRGGNSIKYIVIHHWDDPAKHPAFEGVINWFGNPASQVSAHYVVEAGRVACLVNESDTAWHAGNWAINQQSIGIECNPRCSEADKTTVGELVTELLDRYPGAKIIGHKDIISTSCPGAYYPPSRVLAPYLGTKPAPTPTPAPPSLNPAGDIHALALAVIQGDYGNGAERRRKLGERYEAVQAEVNRILTSNKPAKPNIDALADAVIRGDYGNGDERRRRLGNLYDQVQARVNQKLGY